MSVVVVVRLFLYTALGIVVSVLCATDDYHSCELRVYFCFIFILLEPTNIQEIASMARIAIHDECVCSWHMRVVMTARMQ